MEGTHAEEENKRSKGDIKDADCVEGEVKCMREK